MTKYNQRFWILARNVPGRLIWWRHLMPECQGQATFLGLCLYGCHPHLVCSQIFGLSQIFILLFEFVLPFSCNPQSRLNCEDHYHCWVLLPTTYKISSRIWTISWKKYILIAGTTNLPTSQPTMCFRKLWWPAVSRKWLLWNAAIAATDVAAGFW